MNVFDQFDQQTQAAGQPNVFDQFTPKADPKIGQPEDLTFAERYIAPVLDKIGTIIESDPGVVGTAARAITNNGNMRGGVVGGVMQGAADPGVAIAQAIGHVVPGAEAVTEALAGKPLSVQDEERQYQDARAADGRSGVDLARLAGNVAMTAPLGGVGNVERLGQFGNAMLKGTEFGLLQPVTDGGNYAAEKLKQGSIGAVTGGATSLLGSILARTVSPNASANPKLALLKDEGVDPTLGQSLGGVANAVEEKAQSLPIVGPMIQRARQAAGADLERAAFNRAAAPIGETVENTGQQGIAELQSKLGQKYDTILPKLKVNVLDPQFVDRMSSLRSMVQALPEDEANQFDSVITREIDSRLSPNGTLSGQNLKDAWNALRDAGQKFSRSPDPYQSDLGQAFKQALQELKDHVAASNAPEDVSALKNTDLAYAMFKRLQRAAGALGSEDGHFSPAQFQSAVKALDRSKDKSAFATGTALMQDLSGAGKSLLTNKVPDSGTPGRMMLGSLIAGTPFIPHVTLPAAAGLSAGAALYARPVQNALVSLVSKRPEMAPVVANYLRRLILPATTAAVPLIARGSGQ